jgi:hypothetical protein
LTELDELTAVLAAAGPAHHAAYIETDGDDSEWPLWYANHVVDDVRQILDMPDLTVSRLVWGFVDADQRHRLAAPERPWSQFYAERFAADL